MALAIARLPMRMGKTSLQRCAQGCLMSNSTSNAVPITTLVPSVTQETTLGSNNNNDNRLANELTIIFGVIAAVLAFGSLVFGYLAWRIYKHPGRSRSSISLSGLMKGIVIASIATFVQRRRRPERYGPGSRFEDGCIEMQDAATWKYYEAIDMPLSPT